MYVKTHSVSFYIFCVYLNRFDSNAGGVHNIIIIIITMIIVFTK